MITKLENGSYEVNGKIIEQSEAYALYNFMEDEYRRDDVVSKIDAYIECGNLDESYAENTEFVDAVLSDYKEAIEYDSSWSYMVDGAILRAREDFEKQSKADDYSKE